VEAVPLGVGLAVAELVDDGRSSVQDPGPRRDHHRHERGAVHDHAVTPVRVVGVVVPVEHVVDVLVRVGFEHELAQRVRDADGLRPGFVLGHPESVPVRSEDHVGGTTGFSRPGVSVDPRTGTLIRRRSPVAGRDRTQDGARPAGRAPSLQAAAGQRTVSEYSE
jgi:hypothetical protein